MNWRDIITVEHGKRSGCPCMRGMRSAVAHLLGTLAAFSGAL
jgi:uncharacterized protein (DUF433 family)